MGQKSNSMLADLLEQTQGIISTHPSSLANVPSTTGTPGSGKIFKF